MRKSVIECSQEWAENRKKGKLKRGKMYTYTNNIPSDKPIMFKV